MLIDAVQELRETQGIPKIPDEKLYALEIDASLSPAEQENGGALSHASRSHMGTPLLPAPKDAMGDKGGTAVQQPLPPFPSEDFKIAGTARSERPLTAVLDTHPNWEWIAKVMRRWTANILASGRGKSYQWKRDMGIRTVIGHGKRILPAPTDDQADWILGTIFFADKEPHKIKKSALCYIECAVEDVKAGREPCPDDYFRDARGLRLDPEKATRPADNSASSIGSLLKGLRCSQS